MEASEVTRSIGGKFSLAAQPTEERAPLMHWMESTKWVSLNACIQTSAGPSIWVDGVSRVAGTVEATVSVDTHFSTAIQVHGTLINVCIKTADVNRLPSCRHLRWLCRQVTGLCWKLVLGAEDESPEVGDCVHTIGAGDGPLQAPDVVQVDVLTVMQGQKSSRHV